MNSVTLYQQAKLLHRIFVPASITLGLCMMITGFFLKNPFLFPDFGYKLQILRSIHSYISIFFGTALFVMGATGLYMYLFPLLRKSAQAST